MNFVRNAAFATAVVSIWRADIPGYTKKADAKWDEVKIQTDVKY